MKTLTIEIPKNKTIKEVKELLAKNGLEVKSTERVSGSVKPKSKTLVFKRATEKAMEDSKAGKVTYVNKPGDVLTNILS